MNVIINDSIEQQYLRPYGISQGDVREAVFNEDFKKVIPLDGNRKLIMFIKRVDDGYLFVDGRWASPNLLIYAVFRVSPKTVEKTDIKNPLAVLEKFAEECGYELEIGEEKGKFVHNATVKVPKIYSEEQYGKVISGLVRTRDWEPTSNDVKLQDSLLKFRRGETNDYVDVALAYCISGNKYSEYFYKHR